MVICSFNQNLWNTYSMPDVVPAGDMMVNRTDIAP